MPEPTYREETTTDDWTVYHCLICAGAGDEHHAYDWDLFLSHMAQRHNGDVIPQGGTPMAAPEHEHPHGAPPGQDPDFVPPGQGGTPPGHEPEVEPHEDEDEDDPKPEPQA